MPLQDGFLAGSLEAFEDEDSVVVIDFGATWCSPCRRQRPIFERVAGWFDDERPEERIVFLTVDVDDNPEISARFNVKSVPSTIVARYEDALIVGQRWREKKRFQGIVPLPKLRSAILDVLGEGEGRS